MTKVQKIYDEFARRVERTIKEELPVGKSVSWEHGLHQQFGEVLSHGYHMNVQVRNTGTGKTRWIDARGLLPRRA